MGDLVVEKFPANCLIKKALIDWPVIKNLRRLIFAKYNQKCENMAFCVNGRIWSS